MTSLPCRLWTGCKTKNGYGRRKVNGKNILAHRQAVLDSGRALTPEQVVRHACDNRACIEPTHLIVGTQGENMRDRLSRGAKAGNTRLYEHDIPVIREALAAGESMVSIGRRFGVDRSTISCSKHGKHWSHVKEKNVS